LLVSDTGDVIAGPSAPRGLANFGPSTCAEGAFGDHGEGCRRSGITVSNSAMVPLDAGMTTSRLMASRRSLRPEEATAVGRLSSAWRCRRCTASVDRLV